MQLLRDLENLQPRHLHNTAGPDDLPPPSSGSSDNDGASTDDETWRRANFSPTDVEFVRSLLPPTFIRGAYILAAYIQPDEPPYFLYGHGHVRGTGGLLHLAWWTRFTRIVVRMAMWLAYVWDYGPWRG